MDDETRAYLDALRQDQERQAQQLAQLDALRQGQERQAQQLAQLDARMTAEGERTRRYLDELFEDLRHRLEIVAEGVVANREALDRFRHDVDERFTGVHVLMQAGFTSLRRDVEDLRAGR